MRDRALRRVLTPEDPIGCRRILFSNTFYPALVRDDVSLVTAGIERIEPDAVVTTDGARHPVDVIAYATGFDTQAFLRGIRVTGRDGRLRRPHAAVAGGGLRLGVAAARGRWLSLITIINNRMMGA